MCDESHFQRIQLLPEFRVGVSQVGLIDQVSHELFFFLDSVPYQGQVKQCEKPPVLIPIHLMMFLFLFLPP